MKRYLLTLGFLAGSAPIMSDKRGATQSEFNVDEVQCQLVAKESEGGSAAASDPKGSLFRTIGRRTGG